MLETGNVYTFRVANDATKTDIKRAFHELYDRSRFHLFRSQKTISKLVMVKKELSDAVLLSKKHMSSLDKPITQLAKLHLSKD
jgi:hypothetical protein